MNNAEIFAQTFGIYATEMWAMPESEFLSWLNSLHDVNATNTTDTISREQAINRINKQREHLQPNVYPQDAIGDSAYRICAEFIERLPSAERKGHWIEGQTAGQRFVKCSRCGHIEFDSTPNYCEDCGARMEGEEDAE